jgi:hypothetical protein
MRLLWALGKLGVSGPHVDDIVSNIADAAAQLLPRASSYELANMLWGLARLRNNLSAPSCAKGLNFASSIVSTSLQIIGTLSPQCLANVLWAVVKLERLKKPLAHAFATACVTRIRASLSDLPPQGIANTVWAVAKVGLHQSVVEPFCVDVASVINNDTRVLAHFMPQELSMTVWAIAKSMPATRTNRKRHGSGVNCQPAHDFVIRAAAVALQRIGEFVPQGLSNLAWSFATMGLSKDSSVRAFVLAAASQASKNSAAYSSQAIANLCWAVGHIDIKDDISQVAVLTEFSIVATNEAIRREREFTWQDAAGVLSGLMRVAIRDFSNLRAYASRLAVRAGASSNGAIGTQALLNIGLSAARLGVGPALLREMVASIEQLLDAGELVLNVIDLRQWKEIQNYCKTPWSPAVTQMACPASGNMRGARRNGRR